MARPFDDPRLFAKLISDAVIMNRMDIEAIEVQDGATTGGGLGLYLAGRVNHHTASSAPNERIYVMGLDLAVKVAAATTLGGLRLWGRQFSGALDEILDKGPAAFSDIVVPGLPGTDIGDILGPR